jgi:mannose-6-phosphate isomerase-like protein (cupin superfamily)
MEPLSGGYEIVDFDELSPVACPCGQARRAFCDVPDFPGTIHRTEITTAAKTHYHNRLTETYYILQSEADARMALDGKIIPVKPGMCILIRPGVRHRAIGRMTVLIVVFPKFDPDDEVIVEEPSARTP